MGGIEETIARPGDWLLDKVFMQGMQDKFCAANGVYMGCYSPETGAVTRAYGEAEYLEYLGRVIDRDTKSALLRKMAKSTIESVTEEPLLTPGVRLCGVAATVGGETAVIWLVAAVMEDAEDVPDGMLRTTPERFYKSLEFLEMLSKQILGVKMEELLAQEASIKSHDSEMKMKSELRRNEAVTSILKMLESDLGFAEVAKRILTEACGYLDVPVGVLVQKIPDEPMAREVCCYIKEGEEICERRGENVPLARLPFFNGKTYMLSSDARLPEEFGKMFRTYSLTAGVFLPVEENREAEMYVCFCERGRQRQWALADTKFMNDVRRIIQSIREKRIAQDSLKDSYASLAAILENVGCGIYVRDTLSGGILYANRRYLTHFKPVLDGLPIGPEDLKEERDKENHLFREIYCEREKLWFDYYSSQILWVDGRKVVLCTLYDVTDKKLYQQKIERQANNDFLTGLYNRMKCEQDLSRYVAEAVKKGGVGALFFIDLDDFKHINDGLGHQYGDTLLKDISAGFRAIPGVDDRCYRMGGDEFIIIIPTEQYPLLDGILDAIRLLFSKPWKLKGAEYYCTMSMGVVRFPENGVTVEELIRKGDIAMYDAKCSGKNRISFYQENVADNSYKRLDLEKNMRNATKNEFDEFEVYYQPIVDILRPGMPCVGAEALIRWNSKELGAISPVEFIPLAEYLGLINPIGDFILREACSRCKCWNDAGHPDYKVNVNLSVVQLLQNDVVEQIAAAIGETGINPKNLTLEVTESLAINDMERMKRILAQIRGLGVRVALDDFGTGYSSLNHIREMPIDVIKIDRCFIIDIGKDDFSDAFVKMVAELASAIDVTVCVEGVETEEQLRFLQSGSNKIRLIQGFYFGKPMNAAAFEKKYL